MQVVTLKLNKPGHYWKLGNLVVIPKQPETKSFDLDAIDERMKLGIIRAAEVFGIFTINDYTGSPEMIVQLPKDAMSGRDTIESVTVPNSDTEIKDEPVISVIKEVVITDQDRADCQALLEKKVSIVKAVVAEYPKTRETRALILWEDTRNSVELLPPRTRDIYSFVEKRL